MHDLIRCPVCLKLTPSPDCELIDRVLAGVPQAEQCRCPWSTAPRDEPRSMRQSR